MFNLCLISDFFFPEIGGIQTHIYDLALTAIERGYKVTIVTTVGKDFSIEHIGKIRVVRVPFPKYSGFVGIAGLANRYEKILHKLKPDIIHAHHAFSPSGIIAGHVAKNLNIPAVLTNHSIPVGYEAFRRIWHLISNWLSTIPALKNLRKYDVAIAVSQSAAEFLRFFYSGRIRIIPPPINYEFFSIKARKSEVGFDESDRIVLYVGRLEVKKGIEFAIYAFRIIAKIMPEAKLVIVGPDTTPYAWHLKKLVEVWGLKQNVIFLGKVPREKLNKYYAASDVFIFPSYGGESFGIVVLESMAAGTPIVTTIGGALAPYIRKYGLGYVTGFNTRRFVAAIIRLLEDDEHRKKMGEKARQFAKIFSWNRVFSRIEEIYREVARR